MRRLMLVLVCLALPLAEQALTNNDIIALVNAGISPKVIIEKITASPAAFDTSTDALVRLAGAKVPPEVIKAMVEKAGTAAPPPTPSALKVERVVLGPVLFDYDYREWEGNLVIDERGLTFCCSRNMDLARKGQDTLSHLCYLSFNLPAASITKSYLLADEDRLSALFLVDSANQGYFFSAEAKLKFSGRVDVSAAAESRAQFVHAADALKIVNPQVVQAPMAYGDIKPLYKGTTRVHLSQPARCDKDYTIVEVHQ